MSRWTSAIRNYLLACVTVGHTPVSGATAILNATRRNGVRFVWFKRTYDLRVAFVAAPDGPDIAASLDDLYPLVTPGSLKAGCLHGDNRLGVGVIVLERPLQVPVLVNTNNDKVDAN